MIRSCAPKTQGNDALATGALRDYIALGMSQLLLLAANFFILIVALMGVQSCYFKAKWKWYWLMVLVAVASAMCIVIVVHQWLTPPAQDRAV